MLYNQYVRKSCCFYLKNNAQPQTTSHRCKHGSYTPFAINSLCFLNWLFIFSVFQPKLDQITSLLRIIYVGAGLEVGKRKQVYPRETRW